MPTNTEIERKYLVESFLPEMLDGVKATEFQQGYLSDNPEVRVRIRRTNEKVSANLTIKSQGDFVRYEFKYEIPAKDAKILLEMCPSMIEKTHYGFGRCERWELHVFHGVLEGLILAEIELENEDEIVDIPEGMKVTEVTFDKRFKNVNLAQLGSIDEL